MNEKKHESSDSPSRPPHHWDLNSDSQHQHGRLRASSWDDSDDDSFSEPESKTTRIYSVDEKKPSESIADEINELREQFFKNIGKEKENDFENTKDDMDRRQSPARVKRRTRSSGSLSPVFETENQISPKQLEKFKDGSEMSPKKLDCDPSYYLNNFFSELRSRRISLIDPPTQMENLEEEIPIYDNDCIEMYNELTEYDANGSYFCKTSRKLSKILEVEEKKDSEKSSEENFTTSNLLQNSPVTPRDEEPAFSPVKTAKTPEKNDKNTEYKFRSFSFEYFNDFKIQKPTMGSLSERSSRLFSPEVNDGSISLSAKIGKTHLASVQDGNNFAGSNSPMETSRNEKKFESMESLKLDLIKNSNSENPTPRKSWNAKSPKFVLNLFEDSANPLKAEDENSSGRTSRKNKSGKSSSTKKERNSNLISLESLNLTQRSTMEHESKRSRIRSWRSDKKKEKQKNDSTDDVSEEKICSSVESHRTSESSHKTSSKTSGKKEHKLRVNFSDLTTPEDKPEDENLTETRKNLHLELPLDIFESRVSERSSKSVEFSEDKKSSDRSGTATSKSRKSSERSFDSNTRTAKGKISTPRNQKSTSWRSKNSLENQDGIEISESFPVCSLKELEIDCDAISNDVSNSSTSRSSLKEIPVQFSSRSEASNRELNVSGRVESPQTSYKQEQQQPASRRSSKKSATSAVSSSRSTKTKSRPNSWTPKEQTNDSIDLIIQRTNGSFEENEDMEKPNSKIKDESGRLSNNRLSIINELSFEDIEINNDSSEKEEIKTRQNTTARSRRSSKPNSPKTPQSYKTVKKTPKSTPKASSRSLKEKSSSELYKPDEEKWKELIKTFQSSSNSSFNLENNFPGFQDQKEILWDSIRESVSERKRLTERDEKSKETLLSRRSVGNKEFTKNKSFENLPVKEDLNNQTSENKETSVGKKTQGADHKISQNVYYMSTNSRGSFGIGEFGDVTCWNVAEFGTADLEKPKEHGDGVQTRKTSQVLSLNPELKENEVKSHRELRREQSQKSKPSLNNLCIEEDDFNNFIPTNVKTSKSDNCINNRKTSEGSDCPVSTISSFFNDYNSDTAKSTKYEQSNEWISASKSTIQHFSGSESIESEEKEDVEFNCERTPRLCRSLSNLNTSFQEIVNQDDETADGQLYKKTFENSTTETANLSPFLTRKKTEKDEMKSKNWLKMKNSKTRNSTQRRIKSKKGSGSRKGGYLSTGKSHSSVPNLKLRNPNCFQNFYKRFISVFCLTSNSSAATSK